MKKLKLYFLIPLILLFFTNCSDSNDIPERPDNPNITLDNEINDFIWNGLNIYYLWQDNVTDLDDSKNDIQNDYFEFLNTYSKPEDLFDHLLFEPGKTDRFSWIVDDYFALEQQFQGTSKTSGIDFQLVRLSNSNDIFGYVRYVLPNTDAAGKDIERGDLFLEVDGQQLTIDNYRDLLFSDKDKYTLSLAKIENNSISPTGESVELNLAEYTENPVLITKSFDVGGKKIGYLMYNSFTANFEQELNAAFGQLKAEGVNEMVLDLRYNGGGRIRTAVYLASMLTGQFKGEVLSKERWNSKLQSIFEQQNPDALVNKFTDQIRNFDSNGQIALQEPINSLNLSKLYVLISDNTASASELIINGLKPYIDVKLIGTSTVGKSVGSVTLYDSQDFGREGVNQNHTYAMQPIVLEIVNKLGENEINGFDPDITLDEDIANLGTLGDENEPLLKKAIEDITGVASKPSAFKLQHFDVEKIDNSKSVLPLHQEMYTQKDFTSIINR